MKRHGGLQGFDGAANGGGSVGELRADPAAGLAECWGVEQARSASGIGERNQL